MQQSSGQVGHSKHRKAFVHGHPGESSKGKGGPVSWWQKYMRQQWANSQKRHKPKVEMFSSLEELWENKR